MLQEISKFDSGTWTDFKLKTGINKYQLRNFLKNENIGMSFATIIRVLNYLDYKLLLQKND